MAVNGDVEAKDILIIQMYVLGPNPENGTNFLTIT
jgi:hypothetical protein